MDCVEFRRTMDLSIDDPRVDHDDLLGHLGSCGDCRTWLDRQVETMTEIVSPWHFRSKYKVNDPSTS